MIEFAYLVPYIFISCSLIWEKEEGTCAVKQALWKAEWSDATIVFADDVRNKRAGIEAGRVYKGIDGRARGGRGKRRGLMVEG